MADVYKYHGLGNDYLVIDPRRCQLELTAKRIQLICDRNYGVGGDGILHGPHDRNGQIFFHIYNPDGSEAEKSGNGIRIFAQYLLDQRLVDGETFTLLTLGGLVKVTVLDASRNLLRVDMGGYSLASEKIPVSGPSRQVLAEAFEAGGRQFELTAVTVGNPHAVLHLPSVSSALAHEYGAAIENHPQFPARINVQFVEVLDRHRIRIEIWERGAGYTLASGSSSCAAAVASIERGFVDSPVTVLMPGGEVQIEREDGHLFLTGTVTGVMSADFHPGLEQQLEQLN